jgi:hypothetical protein
MTELDIKRKELELKRVQMARFDMEFRIEECLDQIEKYKQNIKIQQDAEARLTKELQEVRSKQ